MKALSHKKDRNEMVRTGNHSSRLWTVYLVLYSFFSLAYLT